MVTLTAAARPELAKFFEVYEKAPIRIWIETSCSGIALNMELDDEITDDDLVFDVGDYRFIVESDLARVALPIQVDFVDGEFQVTSEPLAEGLNRGCSCGCSCSGA